MKFAGSDPKSGSKRRKNANLLSTSDREPSPYLKDHGT